MVKKYEDRAMGADVSNDNKAVESPVLVAYFFPQHSVTIHAASRAEAHEKLNEHIKNLSNK